MNKSSVRRALTTLKKSGFLNDNGYCFLDGEVTLTIVVPVELTHPKRRTLKTKKVPKTNQIN